MLDSKEDVFGINLSDQPSPDWVDLSENHEILWNLLQGANGFSLFHDALVFFPSVKSDSQWHTIEDINYMLEELDFLQDKGLMAFAADLFGFLFFISQEGIFHMETEDGRLEFIAKDMNSFLLKLVENREYWSGESLIVEWEEVYKPVQKGERLAAKKPFIFGGEFEVDNLYAKPLETLLTWYASLYHQLRDVEDGAVIQLTSYDD